ncbi:hypothetical protein [Neobacillus mesonae]|nr:hypothetical protein [Neobacillus mesonae]MCM3569269.1 hypothetical protein [Neobacillus mesonae]
MESILEQCEHTQSDELCEECTPKKDIEIEENYDIYEYDYNKRLWF